MLVLSKRPVSLAEAKDLAGNLEGRDALADYFKKFAKLSKKDADKLIEELKGLNNIKVKDDDMAKVADFLPQNSEDVHKIFSQTSLSEDEVNSVLSIVKNYL